GVGCDSFATTFGSGDFFGATAGSADSPKGNSMSTDVGAAVFLVRVRRAGLGGATTSSAELMAGLAAAREVRLAGALRGFFSAVGAASPDDSDASMDMGNGFTDK